MRGGLLFENWHGLLLTVIVQHEVVQFEDWITVAIELDILVIFLRLALTGAMKLLVQITLRISGE